MHIPNLSIITIKQDNITDFAAVRNRELAKATVEWVMFVDSDEVVSPELAAEVKVAIQNPAFDAYSLRRSDIFMGHELKYGETSGVKLVRLAKKEFGQWQRPVHEIWVGEGRVGQLHNPLLHTPHTTIASFLDKINRYSTIEAHYRHSQGMRSNLFKIALYPIAKFKFNYLVRLGLLDGVPGTIMAIMMSFHSYLTWTKLYLLWHKK